MANVEMVLILNHV